MSVSSESAEQLTRICLDETQFILKITGVAVEKILVALYVALKDKSSKTGRTQLKNMMKSDKELKVIKEALESLSKRVDFVTFDDKKLEGKYVRLPQRSELNADINESLIVEYYNR